MSPFCKSWPSFRPDQPPPTMKLSSLMLVIALVTTALSQTTTVSTGSIVTLDVPLNIATTMVSLSDYGSSVATLNGREYTYMFDVSAQTTTTVVILPVSYRQFTLTWYVKFTDSLNATDFSVDYSDDISNVNAVVNLDEGAFIATYMVTLPISTFVASLTNYCLIEWVSFSFTRPTDSNPSVDEYYMLYTGNLGSSVIDLINTVTCGVVTIANCPIYSAGMDFDCAGFSATGTCTSTAEITQTFTPGTSSTTLVSSSSSATSISSSVVPPTGLASESSATSSITSSIAPSMESSTISSTLQSSSTTTSSLSITSSVTSSDATSSTTSSVSSSSTESSSFSSISSSLISSSTTTSTSIEEGTIITISTPLNVQTTISFLADFGSSTGTLNGKEYTYIYSVAATTETETIVIVPVKYRQFTVSWFFRFSDPLDATEFDLDYSGLDIDNVEAVVNLEEGAFISTYTLHVPIATFLVSIAHFCLTEWVSFTFTVPDADTGNDEYYTFYTGGSGVIDTIETLICDVVTLANCPIYIVGMDFECSELMIDGPSTSTLIIDQDSASSVSSSVTSSVTTAPVATGSITTVDAPLDVETTISSLAQFGSSVGTINGKEYSYIYDVSAETLTATVVGVPIPCRQFTVTWYFRFTDPLNAVDFAINYSGLDIDNVEAVVNLEEGAFISTYTVHVPIATFLVSIAHFGLTEWVSFIFTVPDADTGDDEYYTFYTGGSGVIDTIVTATASLSQWSTATPSTTYMSSSSDFSPESSQIFISSIASSSAGAAESSAVVSGGSTKTALASKSTSTGTHGSSSTGVTTTPEYVAPPSLTTYSDSAGVTETGVTETGVVSEFLGLDSTGGCVTRTTSYPESIDPPYTTTDSDATTSPLYDASESSAAASSETSTTHISSSSSVASPVYTINSFVTVFVTSSDVVVSETSTVESGHDDEKSTKETYYFFSEERLDKLETVGKVVLVFTIVLVLAKILKNCTQAANEADRIVQRHQKNGNQGGADGGAGGADGGAGGADGGAGGADGGAGGADGGAGGADGGAGRHHSAGRLAL